MKLKIKTAEILAEEQQVALDQAEISKAKKDLQDTDWMVVKAMEEFLIKQKATTGIPDEVLAKRQQDRAKAGQ